MEFTGLRAVFQHQSSGGVAVAGKRLYHLEQLGHAASTVVAPNGETHFQR